MRPISVLLILTVMLGCDAGVALNDNSVTVIDWKVDTIAIQSSILPSTLRIRATSITNMFIVGHNHRDTGILFKFDGHTWDPIRIGGSGEVASDLLPLSETNVLAAGYDATGNSLIRQWNGISWSRQILPQPDHRLTAIGGTLETGIWAGGYTQTLYRLDGTNWISSTLSSLVHDSAHYYIHAIVGIPGRNNFLLIHDDDPQNQPDFESDIWDGNTDKVSWKHFWSFGNPTDHLHSLWPISSELVLIGQPYGLFKAYNSGHSTDLESIDFPSSIWDLSGTSNSDLFAVGGAHLYHYDGSAWISLDLPSTPSMQLTSVWTNGSAIVLLGMPIGKSTNLIVYRGSRRWYH